jgi:preprotein translocase subunit SecE
MKNSRYVLLAFVVATILTGWLLQAATVSAFAQFSVLDSRHFGLVQTSTAIGLVAGLITFVVLIRHKRVMTFADEVVGELVRVTWPTRDETVRASTTVVITAVFTSGVLALYDLLWKNLADLFLFTG